METSGRSKRRVALGITLSMVLTAAAAVWSLTGREKPASPPPEAGVEVLLGEELAWRTVPLPAQEGAASGQTGAAPALLPADFDADRDDELLLLRERGGSLLYEIDGRSRWVALEGPQFAAGAVAWDLERDGTAEVVPSPVQLGRGAEESQAVPVYSLEGTVQAMLSAAHLDPLTLDLDGDGQLELIVGAPGAPGRLLAYGREGREAWAVQAAAGGFSAAGDVDGDGRDELLVFDGTVVVYGVGQEPYALDGLLRSPVILCADLTGDGRDELVFGGRTASGSQLNLHALAFFDPAAGAAFQLGLPQELRLVLKPGCLAAADLGVNGIELAAASFADRALVTFDGKGALIRYQRLDGPPLGLGAVQAGGRVHLAVQLGDRLLMCP